MTENWNIAGYLKKLEAGALNDALTVIGDFGVSQAGRNFDTIGYTVPRKYRTGHMKQNLSYATSKTKSTPGYGEPIDNPNNDTVRIGGNVAYLMRYELGFTGEDSLGRYYDQKARPFLQPVLNHKKEILWIVQQALDTQNR